MRSESRIAMARSTMGFPSLFLKYIGMAFIPRISSKNRLRTSSLFFFSFQSYSIISSFLYKFMLFNTWKTKTKLNQHIIPFILPQSTILSSSTQEPNTPQKTLCLMVNNYQLSQSANLQSSVYAFYAAVYAADKMKYQISPTKMAWVIVSAANWWSRVATQQRRKEYDC